MPKVEQIDIKGIFEKATGHKIAEPTVRVYPVAPKAIDDFPITE